MTETTIETLLDGNREWRKQMQAENPALLASFAEGQSPSIFWIGCCDSRVSLELATGRSLGELFVHRNIANQYQDDDAACRASLSYAVNQLGIRHVVVCGHYECGGVKAVLDNGVPADLTDWLQPMADTCANASTDFRERCEINTLNQVRALENSDILAAAREDGAAITVHALIYDPVSGELTQL